MSRIAATIAGRFMVETVPRYLERVTTTKWF
jgi:hypothetical protein